MTQTRNIAPLRVAILRVWVINYVHFIAQTPKKGKGGASRRLFLFYKMPVAPPSKTIIPAIATG